MVMGSDGLFDNLYEDDIIKCIKPYITHFDLSNPLGAAECIATLAEKKSAQTNYLSPFAKAAHEVNYDYLGGKQDDITVIVAQIKDNVKIKKDL